MGLSLTSLIIIIVCSIVAFILLVILMYVFILKNKKITKKVHNIHRKYEYLHGLLTKQDAEYIRRIEYIAQINLLYDEIFQKYEQKYKHICEAKDSFVENKMENLNSLIKNKKYNQARKEYVEFKKTMLEYEESVNKLNNDLLQVIRPEEECRHMELEAKETYRLIKQDYTAHINDLKMLRQSYEVVFGQLDKMFKEYNEFVEQASYDEATALMPQINNILAEMDKINKTMPELCSLVSKEVPNKIGDLSSEYKRMVAEEYPVYHLVTDNLIDAMRKKVEDIVHNLKNFKYKKELEELTGMIDAIDKILLEFNKERNARATYEEEIKSVSIRVNAIEKSFIKLCNTIPLIEKYYILSKSKMTMRSEIQTHIYKIDRLKRSLDTYVQSYTKKPYSFILTKTIDLKNETTSIEHEMEEFKDYLNSLKRTVEEAHEEMLNYYYRIRRAEYCLRNANIEKFTNKYKDKIDELYKSLETINTCSLITPIDVEKIHNIVYTYLKTTGDSILSSIEIENNWLNQAESTIVYLNQYKSTYSNVNELSKQNEQMFYDGEFEKCYENGKGIIEGIAREEDR